MKSQLENNWWEYGPVLYNEAESETTTEEIPEITPESLADEDLPDDEEVITEEKEDDEETDSDDTSAEEGETEGEEEENTEDTAQLTPEEQELIEAANPLSRRAILKEFPEIFKKFPLLEKAMHGHAKYREIFPSVNDAMEAQEKIETYEAVEADLANGTFTSLIKNVTEKHGDEAFAKVVDNYLPQLREVNETAFLHVVGNIIKDAVGAAVAQGQRMGKDNQQGQDLITAASIMYDYLMGPVPYSKATSFARNKPQEEDQVTKDREKFRQERLDSHKTEIDGKITGDLSTRINKFIDPKESMTPYARRAAGKEATELVESLMKKDKPFQSVVKKLYEQAEKSNYSQVAMNKIVIAHRNKANALIPLAIKKVRSEALKGVGKKPSGVDRQGPVTRRAQSSSSRTTDKRGKTPELKQGMSELDYLNLPD